MPFMFKVAVLIEAIRSNCGGEWARGQRWFLYFVLIRWRYSHSTSRPLPSYSSAFIQFCLFISGWCMSWIVRFRVFIRRVGCAAPGTRSLSSPSVLPTSVTISCLVPSSPCVFACKGRQSVCWPIVKCRHFCVHGYHFLGVSTGCEVDWVCVLVLGRQIMP